MQDAQQSDRRQFMHLLLLGAGVAASPLAFAPLHAADSGGIKGSLGQASDGALDKLARPGAFWEDQAVRLLLPGPLQKAAGILRFTNKVGLTGDLQRSMNDAAGLAAKEAKPIFRSAIDGMTLSDGIGIVTGGDTGATDYLRRTSGETLGEKIRPLIASALGEVGAFDQLGRLGKVSSLTRLAGLDLSEDGLTNSAKDQALNGIFTYIGREEGKFRSNPISKGKDLLKGIF